MLRAARLVLALPALSALLVAPVAARAAQSATAHVPPFDVAPPPSWVERADDGALGTPVQAIADAPRTATSDAAHSHGGSWYALVDRQFHAAKVPERYERRVTRIATTAGVADAAEIRIEFDPSYERLVVHRIAIVRDGRRIDVFDPRAVRILQQETELDDGIYNGKLTALVVLPDVRVGDVVDCETTVRGANPVLDGHLAESYPLAAHAFAERIRVRVVAPESRTLDWNARGIELPALRGRSGDERVTTWERRDVEATPYEDDAPSWFVPFPRVVVRDMSSWHDVAAWAAPLFTLSAAPAKGPLRARIDAIAATHASLEERAREAVRFVQDDVRYHGVEMGESSHRPHDPSAVLAARFGDCKDKALLLVALLRGLGISADVALVNTRLREHLDTELPSPFAFDHAITRVELEGRTLWIDATRSHEGGTLFERAPARYGRALVVAAATDSLTRIDAPLPERPTTITRETFRSRPDGTVDLAVETELHGEDADSMRRTLARTSPHELARRMLDLYATAFPDARATGDADVEDTLATNRLVVRAKYLLTHFWDEGDAPAAAVAIATELRKPRTVRRTAPFAIDHPTYAREEIDVELAGHRLEVPPPATFADEALALTIETTGTEGRAHFAYELRTRADAVAAERVAAHVDVVRSMRDAAFVHVHDAGVAASARPKASVTDGLLATLGIFTFFALVIVGPKVPRIVRRARFRRANAIHVGDTATTPLVVADRAAAHRALTSGKCVCGAPFGIGASAGAVWTAARAGDAEITIGKVTCDACRTARRRYFVVKSR